MRFKIPMAIDEFAKLCSFAGKDMMFGQDERGLYFLIKTRKGIMRADEGDYIIKGVQGEIYPCKSDVFEQIYEEVR